MGINLSLNHHLLKAPIYMIYAVRINPQQSWVFLFVAYLSNLTAFHFLLGILSIDVYVASDEAGDYSSCCFSNLIAVPVNALQLLIL